jgi:hypothetical protein
MRKHSYGARGTVIADLPFQPFPIDSIPSRHVGYQRELRLTLVM